MIVCTKGKLIVRIASCVTHVASTLVSKHASIPTEESFFSSPVTLWVPPQIAQKSCPKLDFGQKKMAQSEDKVKRAEGPPAWHLTALDFQL